MTSEHWRLCWHSSLNRSSKPLQAYCHFEIHENRGLWCFRQRSRSEIERQGKAWDNKEEGIYVDIISGDPLFCSIHKYDSGSGWPSFYEVIDKESFQFHEDYKLGYMRKEIKSNKSNSHLGHVFNDGPKNKTGLRYCINSASLRFIRKEDLKKEGYEKYLNLFE